MEKRLALTKTIVYRAGDLIKDLMKDELEIENKSSKDWVTNIDKETEAFLVKNILEKYPESSFLTEEDTVTFKERDEMWIIDPIDGTSNLIHQKEYFAISIAYFEKQEPIFGIVYDVMKDEMFVGVTGQGAYVNDEKLSDLNDDITVENSILLGNLTREGLFKADIKEIIDTIPTYRYLGSGALDTCRIANKQASAYVFPKIKIWDIAAGLIVLKEVGGTWYLGGSIDTFIFNDESHHFMACANKKVLDKLLTWV